jgi:hypothetical protein
MPSNITARSAQVLQQHPRRDPFEGGLDHGRPLDERDPLRGQIVVEQSRILAGERAEPVEVEVRHLGRAAQHVPEREGGAGHGPVHAQRPARPAHERGLPAAQLAADQHHVARPQAGSQFRAGGLRLLRG